MKEEDLVVIIGGASKSGSISATMLNSISRMAQIVFDIGRTLGSVVRRLVTKSYC